MPLLILPRYGDRGSGLFPTTDSGRTVEVPFQLDPNAGPFSCHVWTMPFSFPRSINHMVVHQFDGTGTGRNWIDFRKNGGNVFLSSFIGGSEILGSTNIVGRTNEWISTGLSLSGGGAGSTLKLWLDGIEDVSSTVNPEAANGNHLIGEHKLIASGRSFRGLITHVAWFNKELDAAEFQALAKSEDPAVVGKGSLVAHVVNYNGIWRDIGPRRLQLTFTNPFDITFDPRSPYFEEIAPRRLWIALVGGVDKFLAGTAAAVSSLAGALPVDKKLGATIAGVSSLTGVLPVEKKFAATVAAVSSLSGALPVEKTFVSTIAALSTLSGALPVDRSLISTVAAASTLAGDLQRLRGLTGQVAGGSTLAGAMRLQAALRGILAGGSSVSGQIAVDRGLQSQIAAVSSLSAILSLFTQLVPGSAILADTGPSSSLNVGGPSASLSDDPEGSATLENKP